MNDPAPPFQALPQRLSLVAQTAHVLREGLRAGRWHGHLPGERELCAGLQISRPTLRAALAELQRQGWLEVAQRRRRRIRATPAAATRREPRTEIAMLSPFGFQERTSPAMYLLDTLRDNLAAAGYAINLQVSRACFSARPDRALEKLVRQRPAAAWLVLGSKEPMQRWFIRQQLPCLVIGSCAPSVALPSVDVDHRATGRHAGALLLRKGHRRLALVRPKDAYGGDLDGEAGLREALAPTQGHARLQVLRHDGSTDHLCASLDHALRSPAPPTAFLVLRSMHLLTVMMHLLRRGKRIPHDVAVIALADDPYLQSTTPAVARYSVSHEQFARRVSRALRQLVETGALPTKAIRLMPTFRPGETV